MGKHTKERIGELLNKNKNLSPEEISEILELPLHKVRKSFNEVKKECSF